jgi:hypothetical protein
VKAMSRTTGFDHVATVTADRLASIVDELFLPLVAAYRRTVRSGA